MSQSIEQRSAELMREQEVAVWRRSDRLFGYLMMVQYVAGIGVAMVMSPRTFDGVATRVHPHVWAAILLGAIVSAPGIFLGFRRPGELLTRHTIAAGQMLTSALLIHVSGGRIETHFHVFGSLAFLAFYRDWRVILTATVVVAADHFVRGIWFPVSVYGIAYASQWRWIEHAFWVVFEDFILVFWCLGGLKEMRAMAVKQAELEKSQREAAARQRLEKEMEIASRIQTGVLPRTLVVDGLELAAKMQPATEVGGDYYDVLPVDGGAWIGIGDVSGHGLTSGLIMLMIQSALAGLGRQSPNAAPRDILKLLNSFLFENVRKRLADDNHATLSLVRYFRDGRIVFAGAHEEIIVCKPDGRCERLETPGPWVGARRNIDRTAVDTTYQLGDGDVMVLYTDGITEAMNADGEQFGMDRLTSAISEARTRTSEGICEHVIATLSAWTSQREDDVTLVVVRHVAEASARAAA